MSFIKYKYNKEFHVNHINGLLQFQCSKIVTHLKMIRIIETAINNLKDIELLLLIFREAAKLQTPIPQPAIATCQSCLTGCLNGLMNKMFKYTHIFLKPDLRLSLFKLL